MTLDRPRLSAEDRRICILDAARHEFARRGFHGTGTAEIAGRAGCSEPMLYKHFRSKQALFAAVLTDAGRRMGARVDELIADADDPLEASLLHVAQRATTDELIVEVIRLRTLAMSLVDVPEVREALEQNAAFMLARVERVLTESRKLGHVRSDIDLQWAAWIWLGFTLAAGFAHALDPDRAHAICPEIARTMVTMLRPPPFPEETA